MHRVHNVRTKQQKYKIYADSQNFVFWFYQNILNFDISPKSPFGKRGLCRYAPNGEYNGCGGILKEEILFGADSQNFYTGSGLASRLQVGQQLPKLPKFPKFPKFPKPL